MTWARLTTPGASFSPPPVSLYLSLSRRAAHAPLCHRLRASLMCVCACVPACLTHVCVCLRACVPHTCVCVCLRASHMCVCASHMPAHARRPLSTRFQGLTEWQPRALTQRATRPSLEEKDPPPCLPLIPPPCPQRERWTEDYPRDSLAEGIVAEVLAGGPLASLAVLGPGGAVRSAGGGVRATIAAARARNTKSNVLLG